MKKFILIFLALVLNSTSSEIHANQQKILNVSYDPTRELYKEYNALFESYWKQKTGAQIKINQSHGGSGKQARSVIDGLEADVVTLALGYDIDAIAKQTGKLPKDWQKKLPNNSCPYTSTIVLLVRKGNPKQIKDWNDLSKPNVSAITPSPKTSGGARWNYLALWGYALKTQKGDAKKAEAFVKSVYKNVPVLDSGARGSTMTFAQRGIGDVLITWENEAYLALDEFGADKFEIVYPSLSIVAEPPVAVVEANAKANKTLNVSKAYLEYLYSKEAQELIAKHHFRPSNKAVAAKLTTNSQKIKVFKLQDVFGSWENAQKIHFDDGGLFDRIFEGK